ncbi:MAG TPA: hypothetical protein VIJ02_13380 [Thermoanaerobaculia bacterium]|jgi:hypothetical protein
MNGRTQDEEKTDPLLQMPDLAVETGIPDLATNIDFYLYGHPKATESVEEVDRPAPARRCSAGLA